MQPTAEPQGVDSDSDSLPPKPRTVPTAKRPESEGKGSFELNFNWPEKLDAEVISTRRVVKNNGAPTAARMKWAFSAERNAEGMVVTLQDVQIEPLVARLQPEVLDASLVFQAVLPSLQIGKGGEFVGLSNYSQSLGMIRSAVERALPPSVNKMVATQFLSQMLAEPQVKQWSENNWATLVSSGIGRKMSVGTPEKFGSQVPLPMTGAAVQFDNLLQVRGPIPCFEGDTLRCLWLEMEATPNPDALRFATEQMKKTMPNLPAVRFVSAKYTTEAVVEAESLVPHWYHLTQVNNEMVSNGSQEMPLEQVQERTDAFHYAR